MWIQYKRFFILNITIQYNIFSFLKIIITFKQQCRINEVKYKMIGKEIGKLKDKIKFYDSNSSIF